MKTAGNTKIPGRFLTVQVFSHPDCGDSVMMTCEGGMIRLQHNMTPNEARAFASHLQAAANECEQIGKELVYLEDSGV